jgi:hypothetical protein
VWTGDGTLEGDADLTFDTTTNTLTSVNINATTFTGALTGIASGNALPALSNLSSVAINTSLLPATDDTIDLGDNTHRWRDIFLGPATIHIGTSTTDEGTITYDTSGNILNFSTDSTTNADIAFFTDDLYLDKSTGFVGINIVAPDRYLHVYGDQSGGVAVIERFNA